MNYEELLEIAKVENEKKAQFVHTINVCVAAGCISCGSQELLDAFKREIEKRGIENWCKAKGVGCLGLCTAGPLISIEPEGFIYKDVKVSDIIDVIDALGGEPVKRILCPSDMSFFKKQQKIVLENFGKIDPERIDEYIASGGYQSLNLALREMSPSMVIEQIVKSGLRGRGGGGYPTGLKWTTVIKASGTQKYVICNADEGDPGAFMDRSVLESDPHRVLEGMAIAGYSVGADKAFIYVRAEYPLAIKRLRKAIAQAERLGVLGRGIFNTPFNFDIKLRLGAGAFVCGEETALISSIEGNRGMPQTRPPYPAEYGLWGCPTLINNVETFANVPAILRNGSQWYSSFGTEKSRGTKVFALAGRIKNTGLIEVAMGTTLREIVFDIGGGISADSKFKAVQTGGPSGGCITEEFLDQPVDYESLVKLGSIMGSGGMIVMDDTSCMVDVAKFFVEFCMTESCGKCVPCRDGSAQMYYLLNKISKGHGTTSDLHLLEKLCEIIKNTSLCGLGMSMPNPVISTMHYFREEYLTHIHDKICPAGACNIEGGRK